MQAASRESLKAARERFDALIASAGAQDVRTLSEDLFGIVGVLAHERVLRRLLADPATEPGARKRLVDTVFGGKIASSTADTLGELVASRWSSGSDLLDAIETLARNATLALAERDGVIEDVEDQLFRFARVLDDQPQLRDLLGDESQPADRRVALLDSVLAGKASPVTQQLLAQVVRTPRGRNLEQVVARLAEAAAARRERSVVRVTAASPLSDAQEQRLTSALTAIYGRAVSVQVELDPQLLGGMVIRVGDEVIDGSVAARLATARQELAGK
jgi:F-type H+-transporting ATPase subunit delta